MGLFPCLCPGDKGPATHLGRSGNQELGNLKGNDFEPATPFASKVRITCSRRQAVDDDRRLRGQCAYTG